MKVKPFEPQKDRYTIVDNIVFDCIMPQLNPNAWKVLCFILRKTRGWHKEWDGLAYSQIMAGTGIRSSATLRKALVELLEKRYIKQIKGDKWDAAKYSLNTALEIEVEDNSALETEVEPALEIKADIALETEVEPALDSKETKHRKHTKQTETNNGASAAVEVSLTSTPFRRILQAKLIQHVSGPNHRRKPLKFPNALIASKFDQQATRLDGQLTQAIEDAISYECHSIRAVTDYIAKWPYEKKGNGYGNTRTIDNSRSTLSDEQRALLDSLATG